MIKKLSERRGDFTISGAFKILLVVALVVIFISIGGVLMTWNKVNMLSSEIVRYIELQGRVDSSVYDKIDELKDSTNLNVTVDIDASCISGTDRIQFGGQFTVTLTYEASFGLGGVFQTPIELHATATGRSEKYWKT